MSDSTSIQDPLNPRPPRNLMERKIVVRPGQVNTVRMMHDPKDADRSRWFVSGERNVRDGNEVTYLVRGEETYAAMAEAINFAAKYAAADPKNNKAIVYLLGWICDHTTTPLVAGDPKSTFIELLRHASSCGVEVRAMLWANLKGVGGVADALTALTVREINSLPTGRAILDAKTTPIVNLPTLASARRGSHHQKVVITHSDRGLVAFCGGVDINRDRLDLDVAGGGLQDVHCRVRGPAAHDLLVLFANRWDDYLNADNPGPDHDLITPLDTKGKADHSRDFLSANDIPIPKRVGEQFVQTGRTTPKGMYPRFRPQGEQSARKMILKGIESAESFIYMEDQYMLNLECADAMAKAAAKSTMKYIILVVPDDSVVDPEFLGVASFHRAEFVKRLRAGAGAKKISIHCAFRFTHSKMCIFDDKYAIIGSANCNRRGWESDSEVVVGVFDESSDKNAKLHFARRLRMKLWADHFNLAGASAQPNRPFNTQDEYAELADGIAAAAHWRKRPPTAFSRPYFPLDHKGESADHVLQRNLDDKANITDARAERFREQIEMLRMLRLLLTEQAVWNTLIDPASPL